MLSVSLSVYTPVASMSNDHAFSPFLSVRLSVCPSVRLYVRLSVCLSVCLHCCLSLAEQVVGPRMTPLCICRHCRQQRPAGKAVAGHCTRGSALREEAPEGACHHCGQCFSHLLLQHHGRPAMAIRQVTK